MYNRPESKRKTVGSTDLYLVKYKDVWYVDWYRHKKTSLLGLAYAQVL